MESRASAQALRFRLAGEAAGGDVAERSTGMRRALTLAPIYSAFQSAVGDTKYRSILRDEFIRPEAGHTILDMGCGPGSMLPYIEPATYVGFEPSENYISNAQANFAGRGSFHVGTAATLPPEVLGAPFTTIVAIGVLHHIDDAASEATIAAALEMLHQGGRLITVDPCFTEDQHPIARYVIARDRGQNVRTLRQMEDLFSRVTDRARTTVRTDMLRIPYTHVIVETDRVA